MSVQDLHPFLFAALNVLEPLYVMCLEAMRGFLDDLERSGRERSPKALDDFRRIIENVEAHSSQRYFILKSIIIYNLYGVDIMDEAVEICKLRLFLKLVAQLDSYEQIEPLPDIDFNIRSGNTLVGFASLEEVKRALGSDMVQQLALPEIEMRADLADRAFRTFRQKQTRQEVAAQEYFVAKTELRNQLDALRNELDGYLAIQDGVDTARDAVFEQWREDNQPFHWFVEFYGIMYRGGFDVIVGNPPYIEVPKSFSRAMLRDKFTTALEKWSRDEDVYVLVVERSGELLAECGKFGMILPLSLTFSTKRPFSLLRKRLAAERGVWWWANFDRIPSALFGSEVRTRCTIAILSRDNSASDYVGHTSRIYRWEAEARDSLFGILSYARYSSDVKIGIPKVGSQLQANTLRNLVREGRTLASVLTRSLSYSRLASVAPDFPQRCVFVGGTAYNWFPAWREIPETVKGDGSPSLPARTMGFQFDDDNTANVVFALLCSSLGYWWWAVASDGFNLKKWLLLRFPLAINSLSEAGRREIGECGNALWQQLRRQYVFKDNVGRVGNYFLPACSREIRKIDDVLSRDVAVLSNEFFQDIREFNTTFSRSEFS